MKKKSKVCWFIYIAAFVVFLYIGYKVPYCHDEWQWGLDERIELMKNGFKDYNGRYLGDLLALLVTRSVLAKAVVLAAGVVWPFDLNSINIVSAELWLAGSICKFCSTGFSVFALL